MQAIRNKKIQLRRVVSPQLEKLKVSCADESLLRQQLELIAELKKNSAALSDLSTPELSPIRALIDKLSQELEALPPDYHRFDRISKFITAEMTNDDTKNYFPEFKFAVNIAQKYPNAFKLYEMIDEKIFSVTEPSLVENFLSIMVSPED